MVQLLHTYMTTRKIIALIVHKFVSKLMALLFHMLSRFVIAFLPRSKHVLISWLQSPPAVIFEPKETKSAIASTISPSICYEVMEPSAMILVFFHIEFQLSLFTLSPSSRGTLVPLYFLQLTWFYLHI